MISTYLTSRDGSGVRSEGSNPLILSPRNEGISFPLTISVGLDLGLIYDRRREKSADMKLRNIIEEGTYFANCPAIRAIRTTGLFAPVDRQLINISHR